MPVALRWLSILLVLLAEALLAPYAAAHSILVDSLNVALRRDAIELEIRSTLRPIVVAAGAIPKQGNSFTPTEMTALIHSHAAYLAQHLDLRINDQLVTARDTHAETVEPLTDAVQAHVDLERRHARFLLTYPLRGPPRSPPRDAITHLSLEQDLLSDAPSDRSWQVSYIVSVREADSPSLLATGLLTRERGFDFTPPTVAPTTDRAMPHDFVGYLLAGLRHILSGWDHLLFVSALVLGTRRLGELIQVVLAFTIAHSITLTLAVLHWVHLPAAIVEPLIAVSIVFVSLENLRRPERGASADENPNGARLAVAFGFGLVHGLGFAGPLVDALRGAPPSAIAIGIAGFSLGVEFGHQLVVLPLFVAVTRLARAAPTHSFSLRLARRSASLFTALGGAFFLIRALETFVFA